MSKVGLLLISHSYHLVTGLRELLQQVQPDVSIAISGGTDGGIGTNAFDIKEAIESIYTEEGIVILFDLGSALINAELALELLDKNQSKIRLADAPLVEGGFAAVVEAGIGGSLQEVIEAAEGAKQLQKITR
ncbi:dihydroxyacetone kinase phosphoryl donor subunit DhaM [Metabacillus litoralis]|uniref:dihydroxyacetone kinase phosphoryl donor subunit DhaM n=1 Tax=Metabacillus litoralis TaxID=152268 RepID=UPI000EF63071|nr:dihydroxyacetone kinase phosphoryl donor subunit DhaM [Metabacillus litoralis]MCM3163369.1 dihydroxyacetone kinase phosphoryl donor subunit DhaM [Metabacillus litoralis]MCM3409447.1 dihydroxyacetone kinase phosphoryl donor subunit DhaM [Metabacillus litoralis]